MSGFWDETEEINQIPDEVTLQLRLPTGLAYAFTELTKTFKRLARTSDEGAHEFVQMLAEIAARN